jgi:hypothetical protein
LISNTANRESSLGLSLAFQQALAVSQPVVKKVSVKDPPTKVKKAPPRKRFVKRCGFNRFGKRVCPWVPAPVRGPVPIRVL